MVTVERLFWQLGFALVAITVVETKIIGNVWTVRRNRKKWPLMQARLHINGIPVLTMDACSNQTFLIKMNQSKCENNLSYYIKLDRNTKLARAVGVMIAPSNYEWKFIF